MIFQTSLFGRDQCVYCGFSISGLLTNAHCHDDPQHERTFRLCWLCHFAYDRGLLRHGEIVEAQRLLIAGERPRPDVGAIHRQWENDLATGRRAISDPPKQWSQSGREERRQWRHKRREEAMMNTAARMRDGGRP